MPSTRVVAATGGTLLAAGVIGAGLFFAEPAAAPNSPPAVVTLAGWNEEVTVRGNQITRSYTNGWDNYFDGSEWKKIDLTITEDASGFHLTSAPYELHAPKMSGGKFRFVSDTKYSEEQKRAINDAPLEKEKEFPTAVSVPGVITPEGILYAGAFPSINGDLLIKPTPSSVQYLVKINAEPAGASDIEIPFRQKLSENLQIKRGKSEVTMTGTGADIGKGVRVERGNRKIVVRPTAVWDSSVPPKVQGIQTIGFFNGKKIVPRSFLDSAQYPVYTDTVDTFTANTADQGITGDNAVFATYRSGSNLALESVSRTTNFAVCWNTGGGYAGYRVYTWWDTSSLPDTAIISSATVQVYYPSTHAALSRTVYLVENRQASTNLATSDWNNIGASGVGTGTDEPYGSITRTSLEAAGSETFTINSTGQTKISKTGNTFYTMIESYDWDNSAPPANSTAGSDFNSADAASNKPTLSVTYTLPSPPKGIIIIKALEHLIPFAYADGI